MKTVGAQLSDTSEVQNFIYQGNSLKVRKFKLPITEPVFDQGAEPICVSATLYEMIRYNLWLLKQKANITRKTLFTGGEKGMKVLDGLQLAKDKGYIAHYYIIGSEESAKRAILAKGVLLAVLPCKNDSSEFWKDGTTIGYHAVSIVGFDQEGFLIKNTWGISWGQGGYTTLKYQDFNFIKELWCIS